MRSILIRVVLAVAITLAAAWGAVILYESLVLLDDNDEPPSF